MTTTTHPFHALTPDFIMDAIENQGFHCDCRTFALNSYENRVYQVGIDEGHPLIADFYSLHLIRGGAEFSYKQSNNRW